MVRYKRDYCNKNYHPHWRAWHARYDMSTTTWRHLGLFCVYCGARIPDIDAVSDRAYRLAKKRAKLPQVDLSK